MGPGMGARRAVPVAILATFALAVPLVLPGCESYWERKDLEREQGQLLQQRELLEQALQRETAGKTAFTEQEKARAGPIWIELRKVENRLSEVQSRLRELD